jgi:hypothetical protein
MSAPHPMAHQVFYKAALEYYVNARAACLSGCVFTTGNLLHHAVEMILKGELSRTVSPEKLMDKKKFGHWLPKCWAAFKALFPQEDLSEYDPMIAELDKFERIRYPDHILANGAGIGFGFGRWHPTTRACDINGIPEYRMAIGDVDAFFGRVIQLCHMNPGPYFSFLTAEGREILQKYNEEAKNWLS